MMPAMRTEGERILYRVLQHANLLQYFDLFISQGGDDVQQLCEAGEEEFLEIMALVGMASKPLHVRRLQKALHEWLTNPGLYQSASDSARPISTPPKGSILASVPHATQRLSAAAQYWAHGGVDDGALGGTPPRGGAGGGHDAADIYASGGGRRGNGDETSERTSERPSRRASPGSDGLDADISFASDWPSLCPSPNQLSYELQTPLSEAQLKAIEQSAAAMAQTLGLYAPRPLNMKKPVDKEIEEVMNLTDDCGNRLDLLRKYSAIYGRFDSKRKLEQRLNMHELFVNEAAAQLCKHRPTLLTRRDDLFPLSRQVVRDAGLQYPPRSAPSNTALNKTKDSEDAGESNAAKKLKFDQITAAERALQKSMFPDDGTDPSTRDDSLNACSYDSQSPDLNPQLIGAFDDKLNALAMNGSIKTELAE